jgi:hypothetical protein
MWSKSKIGDDEKNGKWQELNGDVEKLIKEKKFDDALSFALELYDYAKKHYGKKHKKTLIAMNNLGIVNILRKDFDNAEAYLLLALETSEKISGKYCKEASMISLNLSRLYSARALMKDEDDEEFLEEGAFGYRT